MTDLEQVLKEIGWPDDLRDAFFLDEIDQAQETPLTSIELASVDVHDLTNYTLLSKDIVFL